MKPCTEFSTSGDSLDGRQGYESLFSPGIRKYYADLFLRCNILFYNCMVLFHSCSFENAYGTEVILSVSALLDLVVV